VLRGSLLLLLLLLCAQVKMAEDIDFKYPTRKACAWEISNFCKNIPHGHARVIRCLQVSSNCFILLLCCVH
jgi:Golgi apparatus protein 1